MQVHLLLVFRCKRFPTAAVTFLRIHSRYLTSVSSVKRISRLLPSPHSDHLVDRGWLIRRATAAVILVQNAPLIVSVRTPHNTILPLLLFQWLLQLAAAVV